MTPLQMAEKYRQVLKHRALEEVNYMINRFKTASPGTVAYWSKVKTFLEMRLH